jgi:DNA-binding MarR family transcriptional regulator
VKYDSNTITGSAPKATLSPGHNVRNVSNLARKMAGLKAELNRIGDSLLQAFAEADSSGVLTIPAIGKDRQNAVSGMIRSRTDRLKFIPSFLFADPAWDILLELYSSNFAQYRVSITNLCIASNVPASTALRWIKTLENEGLITRAEDPLDGRRYFMALTEAGLNAMDGFFASEAAAQQVPIAARSGHNSSFAPEETYQIQR